MHRIRVHALWKEAYLNRSSLEISRRTLPLEVADSNKVTCCACTASASFVLLCTEIKRHTSDLLPLKKSWSKVNLIQHKAIWPPDRFHDTPFTGTFRMLLTKPKTALSSLLSVVFIFEVLCERMCAIECSRRKNIEYHNPIHVAWNTGVTNFDSHIAHNMK